MNMNYGRKKKREKRLYDYRGFEGTDVSLEISLFEYGIIWQKRKGDKKSGGKDYYHIIYGVDTNNAGDFLTFDWYDINIDCDVRCEFDWVNFDKVYNFVGETAEWFHDRILPLQIADLLSYYGRTEIFGYAGHPFVII